MKILRWSVIVLGALGVSIGTNAITTALWPHLAICAGVGLVVGFFWGNKLFGWANGV